jgi:hypothetical protein
MKDLRLSVLPKLTKSNTESEEPRAVIPYTLIMLPKRMKDRSESEEPK